MNQIEFPQPFEFLLLSARRLQFRSGNNKWVSLSVLSNFSREMNSWWKKNIETNNGKRCFILFLAPQFIIHSSQYQIGVEVLILFSECKYFPPFLMQNQYRISRKPLRRSIFSIISQKQEIIFRTENSKRSVFLYMHVYP